jgi:CRP-like cAMP-binding protein
MILKRGARVFIADETGNNLIRALRPDDQVRICAKLEPWEAKAGDVLYEPGDIVNYAYFPSDRAMASFRVVLADGRTVETALIGREGAIGGMVSEGKLPAYARAIVQFPGLFHRIASNELASLKRNSISLNNLFARYADCLLAQIFQSTACNAAHSIEQRTAKWILAAIDRTGDTQIALTQEQLGTLLGVGRTYVSRVIQRMKADELIETRRGTFVITDARALEMNACACNRLVKMHFDEVLSGVYPSDNDMTTQTITSARSRSM